jgi:hypothetical protein
MDAAADLHLQHWNDRQFLIANKSWLKGAKWILGEDRERWEITMGEVKMWHETCATKKQNGEIEYDPLVWECLSASISKLSWDDYQKMVGAEDFHWSLVHGDYHPQQMMWGNKS